MADASEIFDEILGFLSNKPVSVHQIVCATGLHVRTVKKYLALIEKIQSTSKLRKEIVNSRVLFRKT